MTHSEKDSIVAFVQEQLCANAPTIEAALNILKGAGEMEGMVDLVGI